MKRPLNKYHSLIKELEASLTEKDRKEAIRFAKTLPQIAVNKDGTISPAKSKRKQ